MIIKNHYKIINLTFSVIIISIFGCQIDAPIKEMALAKNLISRASKANVGKYDPDNLDKAINHLYTCQNLLQNKKIKDAKEEAHKAYMAASLALENSHQKLSSDTLSEAKDTLAQAENVYAEKLSPENFNKAASLIEEAEALNGIELFWESYLKSSKSVFFSK
jgi:hypothetical protein